MRVLRFLRPERPADGALPAVSGDAMGVEAFATEASDGVVDPAGPASDRHRPVLIALAAVVALEAIPTGLWIQSRFAVEAPVASVAPQPAATPPPAMLAAAVPCTTAPASASGPIAPEAAKPAAPRPAAAGLVAGLVSVTAPVPMHVYANGRLVGTTDAETIMLPVGEHELDFVSDALGFRARRSVNIQSGRTSGIEIEAPRVPIHVNAVPWAEVWIDGQRVGETPIGNLQQSIGNHEVIFRHPELGERRMVVTVGMKDPVRISMDMRKR